MIKVNTDSISQNETDGIYFVSESLVFHFKAKKNSEKKLKFIKAFIKNLVNFEAPLLNLVGIPKFLLIY